MFETAVHSSGPQTKRVWTTFVGFGGQALLIGCLVLAPLISPRVLPQVAWAMTLAPPSPPPAPPPGPRVEPVSRLRITRVFTGAVLRAPIAVPDRVQVIDDIEQPAPAGPFVQGGIPGVRNDGIPGGVLSDIVNSVGRAVPVSRPPEPPPAVHTAPAPPQPPRITQLQMAEPVQRINPVYPQIARAARVSGKVELLGILGTDGRIHEIKVLSGHPLLVKAAVDAVMQWVYRPTILNGHPVEVQAPISVNFILN
jgi:protein TonB